MRDHTLRPIDRLNAEWEATCHSARSRHGLALLALAEPEVAALGVRDLGELVAVMGKAGDPSERDRAARCFQAMLRSQDAHPMVPRAALQSVVPGLVTVARRLSWGRGGDWESGGVFFVDAITAAWEVIVEWAGQDRAYAVMDVLSAVRCRLRRQLLHQRTLRERTVPTQLDPDTAPPPLWSGSPGDVEELARSIDDLNGQGVDPADSAALYANQVLGIPLAELARSAGTSRRKVTDRRDRAGRALFA
ncbi:MAG: hypothetical protein ACYDHU_12760 [Acidimicrobiales bacterium]